MAEYFKKYRDNQSYLIILLSIGETAATNSPFASSGSLKAMPQDCPFLQYSSVPQIISKAMPKISPACSWVPYLGPVELLLCLVSPLQMPQPLTVSEKASSRLRGDGLQTPILMSCPLLINIQKQYLPPSVNISVPVVVLNPLPSFDVHSNPSSFNVNFLLVSSGFHENNAAQGSLSTCIETIRRADHSIQVLLYNTHDCR